LEADSPEAARKRNLRRALAVFAEEHRMICETESGLATRFEMIGAHEKARDGERGLFLWIHVS
jgi:hypothetical protein